jgi:hypothetical protein
MFLAYLTRTVRVGCLYFGRQGDWLWHLLLSLYICGSSVQHASSIMSAFRVPSPTLLQVSKPIKIKQRTSLITTNNLAWSRGYNDLAYVPDVAVKSPELFHYKSHTCIITAYWEGSPSKWSPRTAMHLAHRCCLPQLETFLELLLWNSLQCCRHISVDVFNILKSLSL